jgi:hypothetical protein
MGSMAGLRPGFGTAKALIRMRVILAGEGAVRDERGVFRATLPGTETMVEIDDRAGTAQMTGTGGKATEAPLDLNKEALFGAFMHGIDTVMVNSRNIPVCLLDLADEYARVCVEGDAVLASIVSDGNVQIPRRDGPWEPGPAFRGLAEAARHSRDQHLAEAGEKALLFAEKRPDQDDDHVRITSLGSQMRWLDKIERWESVRSASYPAGSGTWVEIRTRSGLHAAARHVGTTTLECLSDEGGGRIAFEDAVAYALYDEAGDMSAVAVVQQGSLKVHKAPDADPVDDEVEILKAEACGDASPGPRR